MAAFEVGTLTKQIMKRNLGTFFGLPLRGMGVALLAFCAFIPVSRAEVIINNLTYTADGQINFSTDPIGQVFTMSGTSGDKISSLTLALHFYSAGSANIELYNTSAGVPTGAGILLGTASSASVGNYNIALSLINTPQLNANTTYAIVLDTPTSGAIGIAVENGSTSPSDSGGTGTLGGIYHHNNGSWTEDTADDFYDYWRMNLTAVPEVPMTGAVMGFGILALAVGGTLRRKLRPALSSIV
jgi:hypothetical protein